MFNIIKILTPAFMLFVSLAAGADHHSSPWDGGHGHGRDNGRGRDCDYIRSYERCVETRGCEWNFGRCDERRGHRDPCNRLSRHECRQARGCDWSDYYRTCSRG